MQGSSLISQILSPKFPSAVDDGYSSPKSEKGTDDDDTDDHGVKTSELEHSDSKKPSEHLHLNYETFAFHYCSLKVISAL